MPPLFDFRCPDCEYEEELRVASDVKPKCSRCGSETVKQPSYFGSYSIKGNNSASQTPKKFRGGR